MTAHYIYIIFAQDSVYIGRTKDLIGRMTSHGMLYCDWAVLETTNPRDVRDREYYWVKHFIDLGVNVLNIEKEVLRPGILGHTPKSIAKMRTLAMGNKHSVGRKLSPERKRELIAASKTPESLAKVSAALKGNKYWLGRKHKPETKAKIGAKSRLQKFTAATRLKESKSAKRRGMSEKMQQYWAWKKATGCPARLVKEQYRKYVQTQAA